MWNGGNVFNRLYVQTSLLQSGYSTFTTAARTFDASVDFLHTKLDRLFSSLLCGTLSGKRRALSASFKSTCTGTCPAKCITLGIGDGYCCVVKGCLDMSNGNSHIATNFSFFAFGHGQSTPISLLWSGDVKRRTPRRNCNSLAEVFNTFLTGNGLLRTLTRTSICLSILATNR